MSSMRIANTLLPLLIYFFEFSYYFSYGVPFSSTDDVFVKEKNIELLVSKKAILIANS